MLRHKISAIRDRTYYPFNSRNNRERIQCIPHIIIQSAKHCRSQDSSAGLYTSADLYTRKAGVIYASLVIEKGKDWTRFHAHKPLQRFDGCRLKYDNLQFGERYYLAFFELWPDCPCSFAAHDTLRLHAQVVGRRLIWLC